MLTVSYQSHFTHQWQYACHLAQDTVLVHDRSASLHTVCHPLVDDEFAGVGVCRVIQHLSYKTYGVEPLTAQLPARPVIEKPQPLGMIKGGRR